MTSPQRASLPAAESSRGRAVLIRHPPAARCNNRASRNIYLEMPVEDRPGAERERFERCFRAHYADVLAFSLRRVSGRELAEDVVADTFAVAWRRRELIPDPSLPWLYGIARRVIANQYRSGRRRRDLEARLAHEGGGDASVADPAEALGHRDSFFAAFSRLSEDEREVLRLVAWDGLATADAARVLGCSPVAFRVRLHRARRKLAKQLRASGHLPVESVPAAEKQIEEAT